MLIFCNTFHEIRKCPSFLLRKNDLNWTLSSQIQVAQACRKVIMSGDKDRRKVFLLSLATSSKLMDVQIMLLRPFIGKDIQIILRLFLVIAMYCQGSSSQIKSITQPHALLAGQEGSLGTCSRYQFTRNNLYTI